MRFVEEEKEKRAKKKNRYEGTREKGACCNGKMVIRESGSTYESRSYNGQRTNYDVSVYEN